MTDQPKSLYTPFIKLQRSNFDTADGKYKATSVYADWQKIDFAFEPKVYINKNGEECIGNVYLPGAEYYVSIKKRQSQKWSIYYSGCVNYDQKLFVNVNIIPTTDTVGEYTISFSKPPLGAASIDPEERAMKEWLPF